MRYFFCIIFFCVVFTTLAAEFTLNEKGSLKGFVFDNNLKQPLEYATITVLNSENDSLINGTITDRAGYFKIKGIEHGNYKVNISFIGYEQKIIENVIIQPDYRNIDLGKILLETRPETLNEAVVISGQLSMTYKIDKKIINVSQQHINASGTAIDILENYPSVSVNIDGSINLRGSSSFSVLVDNKPSILEPGDILDQIPASTIESIEIITNPTAKYNSEGVSGIINIITKKNKLQGTSGFVQANRGMYNNYGGDILLNFKKEKANFYLGANLNNRRIEGFLKSKSWNNYDDSTFYLMSDGNYDRTKASTSARCGIDLALNAHNTLSFQTSIGDWRSGGKTILDYEEYTMPLSSINNYNSLEEPFREGIYYNMDLRYTHGFNKKGHQITSLLYFDRRDFIDESKNELYNLNNDIILGKKLIESGPKDSYNFQVDYTLPFGSDHKFESGYKGEISNYDKQNKLYRFNTNINEYELSNDFLCHVKFDKNIHSFYSLYAGQVQKFGYQVGLRAEYTNRNMRQSESNEKYTIERIDYFPTVHLSYDITENRQFMLSYTRRIKRPKDWQLEPFYTWKDAYNLRLGNPELMPEYIDSYELSFINKLGVHTLSIDAYYRVTNNSIETMQNIYDENIYLFTYENIGSDYSLGVEPSLSLGLFKWWKCNLSGNLYNYRLIGEISGQDFNRESFNWKARFYNTFKIGKVTSIRLSAIYNSPTVTVQGNNQGYFMINASLRQVFLKDFTTTLQARGIFGLLERSKTFESDNFYKHDYIEPFTPIVSLSVSYKIRNYKNNRRRQQKNIDLDEGEGSI